jgi:hypothetical protein
MMSYLTLWAPARKVACGSAAVHSCRSCGHDLAASAVAGFRSCHPLIATSTKMTVHLRQQRYLSRNFSHAWSTSYDTGLMKACWDPFQVRRKGPDSWHQKVQSLLNTSGALNLDEAVQTAQPEDNDWISEKSKSAQQGKRGTQLQYNENQANSCPTGISSLVMTCLHTSGKRRTSAPV